MNLLLLQPGEVSPDGRAHLTGRRHQHAREVLQVQAGQTLRVGVRGGRVGTAVVVSESPSGLVLQVTLDAEPPPRAGVDLVLAIPRPKALKRVIPAVASLGVDRVVLVNAARVEKSYFDSKVLAAEFLAGLVDLGLEQARDTVPPSIEVRERFKPFVEDELDAWAGDARRLVAHPGNDSQRSPVGVAQAGHVKRVVAIGPDGGWVPFEVELLRAHGFMPFSLGPRILRVEVAVPAVLGALSCQSR
ncbi:MAG: 16S rRNA (uracil(1498)-N(3))-methyltransferase [Myxococcota bacterium]